MIRVSENVKHQPENESQTAEEVAQTQKTMCQMISSCNIDVDCSIDLSQTRSVLHLSYIEIEISKEIAAAFKGRQRVEVELQVEQASGSVIVIHYCLNTTKHRQKRFKDYPSWKTKPIPN
ncbi:hypothetical protein NP493_2253g00007 [Ridgeia piscesae]|uniref:Uncharacterized protein n=1 Tax=Ridgeia piscesae TaxID=27915 RepID=A0AAD9JKE3_RIDPI|nr:hypothetical protein NP493_2253g00007 [Ridgeia piscesae]